MKLDLRTVTACKAALVYCEVAIANLQNAAKVMGGIGNAGGAYDHELVAALNGHAKAIRGGVCHTIARDMIFYRDQFEVKNVLDNASKKE